MRPSSSTYSGVPYSAARATASQPPISRWPAAVSGRDSTVSIWGRVYVRRRRPPGGRGPSNCWTAPGGGTDRPAARLGRQRAAPRGARRRAGADRELDREFGPGKRTQDNSMETRRPETGGGVVTAVVQEKGGVGKTTTVINLGAWYARMGYRTLLIDLDPQGNLAKGLGIETPGGGRGWRTGGDDVPRLPRPGLPDRRGDRAVGRAGAGRGPLGRRTGGGRDRADPRPLPGERAAAQDRGRRAARPLRPHPARLPAVARGAHGQRHGRRRRSADPG